MLLELKRFISRRSAFNESRPTLPISRRAHNAATDKFSMTAALTRGRLHWLVRGRPNVEETRSECKPPQHPGIHEGHDAAPPRHPTSKRRGARQRARRTTPADNTGALLRKARSTQLFSFVRLDVRCQREQNPST